MANKTYRIVWEIELDAKNPMEAAKTAQNWITEEGSSCQVYLVQDAETKGIYSVDLQEDEEDAVLPIDTHTSIFEQ